jgi:ABC-type nitrate/sulfonate/bicarbonate transport system permease component
VSSSPGSAGPTPDAFPQPRAPTPVATHPAPVLRLARRLLPWPGVLTAIAALAIPLALWWGLALFVMQVRHIAFPTPYETALRLLDLIRGKLLNDFTIYQHVTDSIQRFAFGFALAVGIGVSSGLLLGWSRVLERLSMPTVTVLQLVPGLAWIPVAILLFGIGERATVFMIAVTAFAPIVINTTAGVKGVNELFIRAARMMGADDRMLFTRILLPGSLPHLLSGLRVGFANGWRVLVAAEMIVGTGTGLGYSIIQSRWTLDYAAAFVCIAIICFIGLTVERGILLPLERRTVERWGLARSA